MVRKWVSAHSSVKDARGVRVLFDWAKVEHPEIFAMLVFEKLLRILSTITVKAFKTLGGVAHNDDTICYVRQI